MNENRLRISKGDKYDLIILYSGGADSRALLEAAKVFELKPYCIVIDYEQLHKEEIDVAKKQLDQIIPNQYRVVKVSGLGLDSGLTGSGEKNESGLVHEMYVSGRNTIFLSIAYSIAESLDVDMIWLGSDWDDRLNLFPDCYQDYIVQVNELYKVAGPKPIQVEAPLMGLSKKNILKLLKMNGINKSELYSGYGDL